MTRPLTDLANDWCEASPMLLSNPHLAYLLRLFADNGDCMPDLMHEAADRLGP